MTVLHFERHPVQPGCEDDFESLASQLLDQMRREPGLLWADIARASDDDPSFVLLSEWRTSGDLDQWLSSQQATEFASKSDVFWREDPTRRRFVSESGRA